jgi:hypothetical protein
MGSKKRWACRLVCRPPLEKQSNGFSPCFSNPLPAKEAFPYEEWSVCAPLPKRGLFCESDELSCEGL